MSGEDFSKPQSFEHLKRMMWNEKTQRQRYNCSVKQNKTWLQVREIGTDGEILSIALRYFETDVLLFREEGIVYCSDGFRTISTKRRINKWSPIYVYQHEKQWYTTDGEVTVLFFDGLETDYEGNYLNVLAEK